MVATEIASQPKGRSSFRTRLMAAMALLATFGMLSAGVLSWVVERQRTDQRIEASLFRAAEELHKFVGTDDASGLPPREFYSVRQLLIGAVAQSVNANDECTLGLVDTLTPWPSAGARDMCEQVNSDTQLLKYFRSVSMHATPTVQHRETSNGSYAFIVVPVSVVGDPEEGRYVVVIDRGGQQDHVVKAYLFGYGFIALAAIGVIIIAAWALSSQILRPLQQLVEGSRAIQGPHVSQRLPDFRNDEVGELAAALNSMLDRLENTFVSQRQLLNDVGHELRTPLTIISGHLELLDTSDAHEFEATRALVLDEIDRMSRLVDSLVTLAKADNPDFVVPVLHPLAPLLDDVLDKARALADRQWHIATRTEVSALIDSQRITQALLELITNAIKHSAPGSVITLGLNVSAGQALLSVADEGCGIPTEEQERIFERFMRGNGETRVDGAGLGLAIVQRIATAHGGYVSVESTPGKGSCFTLSLPVAQTHSEELP